MTPKINWKPSNKDLRWFGVVVFVGFGVIGFAVQRHGHAETARSIWAISSAIATLALISPPLARPFYFIWMFVALIMGSVMSRIVMGMIYYLVLTPVALFFRLIGRDVINRKKPKAAASYWAEHPVIEDKKYYEHLF